MNNITQWIKANLVIVICIAVIILSMASLIWPTGMVSGKVSNDIDERARKETEAQRFINSNVPIPSEDPNQPQRQHAMTVNAAAVTELERIFSDMNRGYDALRDAVSQFNQLGPGGNNPHVPMENGLFPKPQPGVSLYAARTKYKDQLVALYNTLNAGMPPADEEYATHLRRVEDAFADRSIGVASATDPALLRLKAEETVKLMVNRAQEISVYAPPTRLINDQLQPGIFDVDEWVMQTTEPQLAELWEGQMSFWIHQDIVMAVRVANHHPQNTSVLQLPVKRIVGIEVVPGYIGLVPRVTDQATATSTPAAADDLNQPLPRNFVTSPTGRRSNSLYDVRHAIVTMHIDARQLPKVLNAFGHVNLMTPIVRRITAVNQAELMSNGFVYGDGVDVVEVELLIESLWLRQWTAGHTTPQEAEALDETFNAGLMPDAVRFQLSLPTRDPNYQPPADATTRTGEPMYMDSQPEFSDGPFMN